jgi:hypothetical protein
MVLSLLVLGIIHRPCPSIPCTDEGEALAAVVTLVLQIIPELHGLCASHVLPSSEDHVNVNLSTALSSPEQSDVIFSPIRLEPMLNPDALLAKRAL